MQTTLYNQTGYLIIGLYKLSKSRAYIYAKPGYYLPSADEILLLSKEGWKLLVKRTLRVYWEDQLRREA